MSRVKFNSGTLPGVMPCSPELEGMIDTCLSGQCHCLQAKETEPRGGLLEMRECPFSGVTTGPEKPCMICPFLLPYRQTNRHRRKALGWVQQRGPQLTSSSPAPMTKLCKLREMPLPYYSKHEAQAYKQELSTLKSQQLQSYVSERIKTCIGSHPEGRRKAHHQSSPRAPRTLRENCDSHHRRSLPGSAITSGVCFPSPPPPNLALLALTSS